MTELEFYKTEWERAKKGIEELSKALEESESREKELCILAENMKAQIEKMKRCGNCCKILSCFTEKGIQAFACDKWELAE